MRRSRSEMRSSRSPVPAQYLSETHNHRPDARTPYERRLDAMRAEDVLDGRSFRGLRTALAMKRQQEWRS